MKNNKTLITITTCNRLSEIQKYIWGYITFCNKNEDFDFILALDGKEDDYIDFCSEFEIPLICSDEREGVGLSKNRVLKQFPDYEHYFFIDDDVELIDSSILIDFINISKNKDIHHATLCNPREMIKIEKCIKHTLSYSKYGGAYFNFYTHYGLEKVGGWHSKFAKFKRFGHTEHSYRYYHNGLSEAPFISLLSSKQKLILHNPTHVTNLNIKTNENQLIDEEQNLIDSKATFFPITTLSDFHFNGFSMSFNKNVDEFLKKNKRRYPLTKGKERRVALAEHYFLRIKTTNNFAKKALFLFKSIIYNPLNTPLKHFVKTKILRYGRK